jgi:hypothetical protein
MFECYFLTIYTLNIQVSLKGPGGDLGAHVAITAGYINVVKLLLEKKTELNGTDAKGRTLLHLACLHGDFDICALLLEAKAAVDSLDSEQSTPMWLAAVEAVTEDFGAELLDQLVLFGANPNARHPSSSLTLLQACASKDRPKSVEALLQVGAKLDQTCAQGRSALHYAAQVGAIASVRLLIGKGAAPNLPDAAGSVPMHLTTDVKVGAYLVAAGGRPEQLNCARLRADHNLPVEEVNKALTTFAERAAQKGDGQVKEEGQWIGNNLSNKCMLCPNTFGFLSRRHHCRRCGILVCGYCSTKFFIDKGANSRACDVCFNILTYLSIVEKRRIKELQEQEEKRKARQAAKGKEREAAQREFLLNSSTHKKKVVVEASVDVKEKSQIGEEAHSQIQSTKQVMAENKNMLNENIEKLNQIEDRAEQLQNNSALFLAKARALREQQESSWF